MTKERKLAIEMWKTIRQAIIIHPNTSISLIKADFCAEHNLNWDYNCWFCQYMRNDDYDESDRLKGCTKCPIAHNAAKAKPSLCGCLPFSLWDMATNSIFSKEVKLEACDKIIKALGGKV